MFRGAFSATHSSPTPFPEHKQWKMTKKNIIESTTSKIMLLENKKFNSDICNILMSLHSSEIEVLLVLWKPDHINNQKIQTELCETIVIEFQTDLWNNRDRVSVFIYVLLINPLSSNI